MHLCMRFNKIILKNKEYHPKGENMKNKNETLHFNYRHCETLPSNPKINIIKNRAFNQKELGLNS